MAAVSFVLCPNCKMRYSLGDTRFHFAVFKYW